VIFFLADASQQAMHHCGRELSSADVMFTPPNWQSHQHAPAESSWRVMSLSEEDLATAGRALVGREPIASAEARLIHPSPQVMSRLMRLHKATSDLAETAPDILTHAEVARAIEQELIRAMIACLAEPVPAEKLRPSRQRVIQRFEQAIEEHQDQPLYVAELCAAIGVPERTLRTYCQEHLRMSPHRYLWLRRMHQARRALAMAERTARTVTQIANDQGFGELGRFAVEYRKLFGELPSMTLRGSPDSGDRRANDPRQLAG